MKRFIYLIVLTSVACVLPEISSAQRLGLKFGATDPDAATSSLLPEETAGVVPQANWNNLAGATGNNTSPLVYDNGSGTAVPSTAAVSWNTTNTWRSGTNNAFTNIGDRKLMSGYLDINIVPQLITVNVNNLDAALASPSYDVYVYFLGDSTANRGGGYTLTPAGGVPTTKFGSTMAAPTMHVEDPGTDVNLAMDGTYLKFPAISGSSFTLVADQGLTNPAGTRAPINGIQIVKSTIVPGDVNGDGQVTLADFHIIRGNLFKTGQTRAQGDLIGGTGLVDFADYREWKIRAPAGLAATADLSIPEPAAAMMFVICGSLLALFNCRGQRKAFQSS